MRDEDDTHFPKLTAPTRRTLSGAGYTRLDQLAQASESDLGKLHGMEPTAVAALRAALKERVVCRFASDAGGVAMAKLIYSALASLDGYVEDSRGKFDWAAPDEEVHAFVNDLERPIGTYLYGRRMYETMMVWGSRSTGVDQRAVSRDFAEIWQGAEKIVYSRTLHTPSSTRTRIEREFDASAVRLLKESSASDISVGGAELAGSSDGCRARRRVPSVLQPDRGRRR